MPQIISSAIVNAPPPHPVVKMLMRTNFACEQALRCAMSRGARYGCGLQVMVHADAPASFVRKRCAPELPQKHRSAAQHSPHHLPPPMQS